VRVRLRVGFRVRRVYGQGLRPGSLLGLVSGLEFWFMFLGLGFRLSVYRVRFMLTFA
jgi:hypothetical protein